MLMRCTAAGTSYVAVFGAGQSQLESVLLKRKIMGPSWLQLKHPVRTQAVSQARGRGKIGNEQYRTPCLHVSRCWCTVLCYKS